MGWERGRYYTRSKKIHGCVVREYVGTGRQAELAAQSDALKRQQQETRRAERAELDALDGAMNELNELGELLARAALLAAGYHLHNREWRKRRGQRDD